MKRFIPLGLMLVASLISLNTLAGSPGNTAVGGALDTAPDAARVAEAPDETELKSDDLKTLQDARDLQNE